MGRKTGIDKLVEDRQSDAPVLEPVEQLGLDDQGELFGPITPPKPGRPRGAVNNSTKEWAKRIIAAGASPLEFWARVILRDIDKMMEEWSITRPEVLAYKMEAAKMLAPYVHKKMPVAVDLGGEQRHVLVFGDLGDIAGNEDGFGAIIDVDEKGMDNQALTKMISIKSDVYKSDE